MKALGIQTLTNFAILNVCAVLGFAVHLLCRFDRVAGYLLGTELCMLVVSIGATLIGHKYDSYLEAKRAHERDLAKLSKKKGIEF